MNDDLTFCDAHGALFTKILEPVALYRSGIEYFRGASRRGEGHSCPE